MIYCRDYASEVEAEAAKDELASSKKTVTNKDNGRVASIGGNEIKQDVNLSDATMADGLESQEKKKKKKSKPKKKKKKPGNGGQSLVVGVPNKKPIFRGLNEDALMDYYIKLGQTDPPTIPGAYLKQKELILRTTCRYLFRIFLLFNTPLLLFAVAELFPGDSFPVGELQPHPGQQSFRATSQECAARERLQEDVYVKTRHAAEVHRQVRGFANSLLKPGMELADLCAQLENKNRELVGEKGLERGIAFPTGCSLNNVAAHYTPNPGDHTVLQYDDVMKLDFGTQVGGHIVDSAWTVAFNPRYDPLLESVREATNTGLMHAGIDARICDVAEAIQETMESYEVELNGKTYPIKAIRNLNGHNIAPYQIHSTKSVPCVKNACEESLIMEEGEVFAIETFGSTGRGYTVDGMECSHYMKRFDAGHVPLRMQSSRRLLSHINKTFGTLAFCRRWLEREDGGSAFTNGTDGRQTKYMGALKNLCDVVSILVFRYAEVCCPYP